MIPNLIESYSAGAKWAFPILLAALFLYHFISNYFSARVQQDWLNRLQATHGAETKEQLTLVSCPRKASMIRRWKRLLVMFGWHA